MDKGNTELTAEPRSKKAVFLGVLILALQIGILFAYGFAGQFQFLSGFSDSNEQLLLPLYFYMTLFAVGMGLMLSFWGKGTALGLGTAIFTLALNILLGPLLQKFWFNVFIGSFDQTSASGSTDLFVQLVEGNKVKLSSLMQTNAASMTISYLISSLAFIGRAGLFEIFMSLLVFNVMWPIPLYVNIKIYLNDMASTGLAFDDFGLTYIYTFAAFFGIVYSLFLNAKKQKSHETTFTSRSSAVFAIFGATLVFCTIPSTGFQYPYDATSDRFNVGVLNMYYSQIASIISCTIFSLLFGKGRFRLEQIIVSVLSGPAISAQLAGTQGNIVAFLTIGAFGGLLTALWIQVIHPAFNKNSTRDSVGLIGSVLIPSLVGGIVVAPVMMRIYIDNGWSRLTGTFTDSEYIRHNYIYYFITVGAALVAAIIAGIFALCSKDNQNDNLNVKIFSPDFGLCNNPSTQRYVDQDKHQSAQNLKKN